ncbi:hypothetical protein ACTFIW_004803 [Dictyostelium discoideum]
MAFGTQKESSSSSSSSIFNNYNISNKQQQKQQQDNNKNNSNLSMLLTPQQFNDPRYGSPTEKYLALLENTHITCRGNIISNQQQQQQQEQQSTGSPKSQTIKNSSNNKNNNTSPRKNKNKKSPTMNSFNSNKLFKKSLTSSSDSSSDEYSESEEEEEEEEEQVEVEEDEDEENSDKGDLNDKSTKFLSNKQKSIHEQEDLADDDSSDLDSNKEEEDYSLTSEEEEILSDDESTDKSSSEEEEEEDSESESEEESGNDSSSSVTDESDEENHNREWSNVNSNLSLKKSVSSILFKFTDCDSTSDSDEEMDSSSGQEGSFSDKDIDVFDDSFLQVPTSYSINISPRKSSEQLKQQQQQQQSGDFEEVDGGYLGQKPLVAKINENKFNNGSVASSDDDDELNNGNRYYDDSEEELNREIVKREQENDKKVLVAIRKSINGINSGDNESMVEKPCWYGFEDDNHIKVIFQHYSSFLQIDQEVKHTLRGPKPFIGRVHRRAIKYDGGEVGCKFTTLDTVKVYRWEIQPIGRPLNLYKSFVLLTRWDEENGLPTKFQKVNSLSNKDFWANEAKSLKSQSKISSYLYCSPMFDTDFTFNYSIDSEKYPVDFLPNSPILSSRRNHHHHSNSDGSFDHHQQQQQQQQQNHHSPKHYLHPLTSLNRNNKLSDSQLLPSIKTPTLSVGGIVPQRRSSHPSLLLSSHIYSHSITFGFKDKCNNDLN